MALIEGCRLRGVGVGVDGGWCSSCSSGSSWDVDANGRWKGARDGRVSGGRGPGADAGCGWRALAGRRSPRISAGLRLCRNKDLDKLSSLLLLLLLLLRALNRLRSILRSRLQSCVNRQRAHTTEFANWDPGEGERQRQRQKGIIIPLGALRGLTRGYSVSFCPIILAFVPPCLPESASLTFQLV
ncbi:hypothetical protein, variant [Cladophialophora immunda]|uniref:Uncharacterized protein n=1 Tax=Cladophialophora immunda TaxID=569365 RepID=A0A0D2AP86_9EURO|nr:hypothetical protein, variant [Cladophialophora immunda]KIW26897.1 hypothetical protein, variant [Cladophialophora immunda]